MDKQPRVRNFISSIGEWVWGQPSEPGTHPPFVADCWHTSTDIHQPPVMGLVSSVTSSGGKRTQQDAAVHFAVPSAKIAIVADGISSTTAPELAAETAVQTVLCELVERARWGDVLTADHLRWAFQMAHTKVRCDARAWGIRVNPPGTTLIVGIELPDRYLIGYAGDGAVVYASGSLHWITNVLHPQTGRGGAIAHYVGMASSSTIEPAVVELPKIHDGAGGVLILGTDGALPLGSVLTTLEALLPEVRHAAVRSGPPAVRSVLENWVNQRIETDDNRSLALLVSQEALACWQSVTEQSTGGVIVTSGGGSQYA